MWEQTIHTGATLVKAPAQMYQRSYEGEPGYISPRCWGCYEKVDKSLFRKIGDLYDLPGPPAEIVTRFGN